MAEAELKWKNTALLVIDMQKDFIFPGGPVHVKGGAAIVPNVVKAVEEARSREIPIIWVVREHDPLGRDVELFRRHFYAADKPKPTSKGSVGAELVDGLVIKNGDYKLVKTRFSAFFNTHLHSYLQGAGINKLVVTGNIMLRLFFFWSMVSVIYDSMLLICLIPYSGVQTPNCIRQTVFDAVALDYHKVTVIVDATAAATPDVHIGKSSKTILNCFLGCYEKCVPFAFGLF
ncbi:probable inactive nicotinamidase At3g16190 isoform X1 [Salvia miltiorrhiza]|uniref:probable inactive nicotinamidase At3g16190 isoform X1 n=1 Tax=Salvia miltiorrhiza TaxID=226208 RepID=UPI0025AC8C41|nr:probable inactive nicotinamidase At3g16190 isoform X1 [Salvia miltiorrhiza]